MKFNHLNVPTHWRNYWSRYPEGHTILEALISWVSQVDSMVDNVNDWNIYLNDFVKTFDTELQTKVFNTLREWQDSGFLNIVISEALQWELDTLKEKVLLDNEIIVNIPTDFPDIQSAIDRYANMVRPQGAKIVINIENNHALTRGFQVRHGDFSYFEIISDMPVVFLDNSFQGVTGTQEDYTEYAFTDFEDVLMAGINATMPVLGCLIDMQNRHGTGYFSYNSRGIVKRASGVINAGFRGVYLISGYLDARGSNFSGAMAEGFYGQHSAVADFMTGNFDNCCKNGTGNAAIYVSKSSMVGVRELSAINSGTDGLKVRRATVDAERSDFSNATGKGIVAEGQARVSATGAKANSCGTVGVEATQLSILSGGINAVGNGTLDVRLFHGAMAMVNETTRSTTTGNYPDVLDTNIRMINTFTGDGLLISSSQPNTIESGTTANGFYIRFADGTQITYHYESKPLTLAVGEVSGLITRSAFPREFTVVYYADIKATGRGNIGGGGTSIGLDVYARDTVSGEPYRVKNTGIQLNGTDNNLAVNHLQTTIFAFGRWK